MATTGQKAKNLKRQRARDKYAELREQLKADGDYASLSRLPRDASPTRVHNRCALTGRPRGYLRKFNICRNQFRELSLKGMIPGVRKSSW
jgi:small subunit ribosomal protein S14